jgi:branched-chain amino acid transport system ATP-binding protein
MARLLEVQGLEAGYGKKTVLQGVSFHVGEGEIVAVLGHNGAGKSTTLKTILGLLPARAGQVRFAGRPWANGDPGENVRRGLALVPQGRGVFPDLNVRENLELGAYAHIDREARGQRIREVFELFPILAERSAQLVGTLSGGQQQMVAVGRALMTTPRLLMLDEPSLGIAPRLVRSIMDALAAINRAGVAIFLVEQNVPAALGLAHRAYVLESGRIAGQGLAADLLRDPHVRRAYLGPLAVRE